MARWNGPCVVAVSGLLLLSISYADAFVGCSAGILRVQPTNAVAAGHGLLLGVSKSRHTRAHIATGLLGVKSCDATDGEGFRAATAADKDLISKMVKDEKMNPLFLDVENFVIAQDDDQQVVGFGQIRPLGKQYELASLVVRGDMRGNGIGTALVNELLERHKAKCVEGAGEQGVAVVPDVFLLTIKTSTPFYSRMGFLEIPVSLAPMGMQMEAAAGGLVAKMSGATLTCMRYKFPSTELKCSGSGTVLKQANQM